MRVSMFDRPSTGSRPPWLCNRFLSNDRPKTTIELFHTQVPPRASDTGR